MAQPETKQIAASELSQIGIDPKPRIYTEADICAKGLPVVLADRQFMLPVEEPVPGVRFAWLDPTQPELGRACAVELGVRLAELMGKNNAVLVEPPSEKSGQMTEAAAQIAANQTGNTVTIFQAGGGLVKDAGSFFSKAEWRDLDRIEPAAGTMTQQPRPLRMKNYGLVWAVRYKPVTKKDKFMFLTIDQLASLRELVSANHTILATVEDVVTTGTTVEAIKRLMRAGDIRRNNFQVIAAAREGDGYSGEVRFAIQIPKLD